MATTDENKAARTQQSQEVARDAAEAYRAAVNELLAGLEDNVDAMRNNDSAPQPVNDWRIRRAELRDEARQLVRDARALGIERTTVASKLGVSRQTIHEWLNEGES